jgi:hypothetical protein
MIVRFCYAAITAFSLELALNVKDWVANPVLHRKRLRKA